MKTLKINYRSKQKNLTEYLNKNKSVNVKKMFPADYKKQMQKIMDALIQENDKVIYRNQIVCLFVTLSVFSHATYF